jgi:radical SAM protein with 4Fe4S-binding SPASM domain
MDWDVYRKIIDDLCTLPESIKTLRLYKNGEPLMNPMFVDMVRYAKSTGSFEKVDTTTNGSLLNPRLNMKLMKAGLDAIFISVPTSYSRNYKRNVAHFYTLSRRSGCRINVKIIDTGGMSENAKQKFMDDFGDISDQIFIENLAECWPEYEIKGVEKKVGLFGQELKDIKVCSYIFYGLVINSNGTVSLCCQDWKHELIVGDLKMERFRDIWNGEKLKKYQVMHLEGKKDQIPMCKNCGQLALGMPDDIDQYAEEILGRVR